MKCNNMQDHYITFKSSLGKLTLTASKRGLRHIFWNKLPNDISSLKKNTKCPILQKAKKQLIEYFQGKRKHFSIPLDLYQGTVFQKKAWQTLQQIPYGKTISYQRQAENAGCPKGYRAIGNANGKNPIPIIIPCHRVIAKNNLQQLSKTKRAKVNLGGFTGGITKKIFLLKLEKAKDLSTDHSIDIK